MSADAPWSDEDLMAAADGQLDGERQARLAAVLEADPSLRARVQALAAQRARVAAAYAGVLDEPVPERLAALLAAPPAPAVVLDLAAERARRAAPEPRTVRPWPSGWAWGGMAASLVLGLLLGLQLTPGGGDGDLLRAGADGRLVAGRNLAQALETQAAGDAATGRVALPLSFLARDGRYCRVFRSGQVAGLACREASEWQVGTAVAAADAPPAGEGLRQAAAPLPQALLDAVDARIEGEALTAEQERAARDRGWRR